MKPTQHLNRLPKWSWPVTALIVLATAPVSLPTIGLYLAARRFDIRARSLVALAAGAFATTLVLLAAGIDPTTFVESWPPFGASPAGWIESVAWETFGWLPASALIAAAAIRWNRRGDAPDRAAILARIKTALAPKARPAATPDTPLVAVADVAPPPAPIPAPEEIRLGIDHVNGGPTGLYPRELHEHALLLGATGSGKTTTLLTIIQGAADLGIPVVVIDLKGSPGFSTQLGTVADLAGRRLARWSLSGDGHWNPLARGDASELKDKLVGMEAWTEPHYKRAAERYLQTVFTVLEARDERPSMDRVVELMDAKALNAELREIRRVLPTASPATSTNWPTAATSAPRSRDSRRGSRCCRSQPPAIG